MIDFISQPWPWYVAGPLIGLTVPLLLLAGGRMFGISSNLQHMCAAVLPTRYQLFHYDWKSAGTWNLIFAAGILIGGIVAGQLLAGPDVIDISDATRSDLALLGVTDFNGFAPGNIFSWSGLLSPLGVLLIVLGGFLVGFGSRYAGGCTSGHAIMGLADFQKPSFLAVIGFFAGGLIATHFLLPLFFR